MAGEPNVNGSKRSRISRTSQRHGMTDRHGVNVHIPSKTGREPLDVQPGPTIGESHVTQIRPVASRPNLLRTRHLDWNCCGLAARQFLDRNSIWCGRGRRDLVSSRDACRLRRQILLAKSPARLSGGIPSGLRRKILLAQRLAPGKRLSFANRTRTLSVRNGPPHQVASFVLRPRNHSCLKDETGIRSPASLRGRTHRPRKRPVNAL